MPFDNIDKDISGIYLEGKFYWITNNAFVQIYETANYLQNGLVYALTSRTYNRIMLSVFVFIYFSLKAYLFFTVVLYRFIQ